MQTYIGMVVCVGFNWAPVGWAPCDGRLLQISQNEALYTLIGTTYGGDGVQTFGLPDLRGRTAVSMGQLAGGGNYVVGQRAGAESVTIQVQNYPAHTHTLLGTSANGTSGSPTGNLLAAGSQSYNSNPPQPADALNAASVSFSQGGSRPHDNLQPYLTCNWIIALEGIYPTRD